MAIATTKRDIRFARGTHTWVIPTRGHVRDEVLNERFEDEDDVLKDQQEGDLGHHDLVIMLSWMQI